MLATDDALWDELRPLMNAASDEEFAFLREGFRAGASLRTTLAAQLQPGPRWALRLAVDGRLEGPSDLLGVPDPVGSGVLAFVSPDVLFSPVTDVVLELGVRVPVLNLLHGHVRQSPILQASVVYDL